MKHVRTSKAEKTTAPRVRPALPRVALLIPAWSDYGRGMIEGVWEYAQQHGPWLLEMQPGEPDENTELPRGWTGDGVIASIHTRRLAAKLRVLDVPVINVSGSIREGVDFPRVTSDAHAVMRMAVTHLREKGLKHIVFCGEPQRPFIDFWTDAFRGVMAEEEMETIIYQPSALIGPKAGLEALQIVGWATGICRYLAIACTEGGIKVPEDVAIISLETEDLLGRVVHPPLSGVDIPIRRIGYEAAAQLDRLLHGKPAFPHEIHLPPLGVTTRQSTDLVACGDPQLRQALSSQVSADGPALARAALQGNARPQSGG
jgi:LacI family transcriptional regulator